MADANVTAPPADAVVDLRGIGPRGEQTTQPPPTTEPFNPDKAKEEVRGTIAKLLVWTLVGVVGAVMLIAVTTMGLCWRADSCRPETLELKTVSVVINLLLTPLVGLVGAVTGFYFGEKAASPLASAPNRPT